jgi:hypothetical protein
VTQVQDHFLVSQSLGDGKLGELIFLASVDVEKYLNTS